MSLVKYWKNSSPITKVAISWASWATVCLTGYYFARIWAADQRVETLKIRETINNEFNVKLAKSRQEMEARDRR